MGTCSLRAYDLSDAESLSEAARQSVPEVSPWLPWCHEQYSVAEAIEWIRSRALLRATEAVRHLAEFAFRNTDLMRLEIVCAIGNVDKGIGGLEISSGAPRLEPAAPRAARATIAFSPGSHARRGPGGAARPTSGARARVSQPRGPA